ncbi:class II aldolase/adducin family protein [Pseudactinotalea sp. HY160]|nr:class II aldolase/adducin family protein [Pseudactinotalea sp. HY160]QGH70852.1 class II aldolase/adducin family protein [Pseudactinotalea sp. HY158]
MEQLVDAGNVAVTRGLVHATGGNLSAREPGSDRFLVTGAATQLDRLTPADFTVVSLSGRRLGGADRPSSEWKLHQRTYVERSDAGAIVHVHPQYAVLLDALDLPIRHLTLDHAHYVASIGQVPFFPNGSDELADGAAAQAHDHNCIVLSNHGCSTIGDDVLMALRRALLLEESATMTFRALQLGDRTTTFGEGIRLMHA